MTALYQRPIPGPPCKKTTSSMAI